MKTKRKKWFVCRNKFGVHYIYKDKAKSLHEFWDTKDFAQVAIYGPTDKKTAIEYVNDMNTEDLFYGRPNNTIIFDDLDDDDYAGLISDPKS